MLKQRILTAVILLFILVDVLVIENHWPFILFISLLAVCATWEWCRLTCRTQSPLIYVLPVGVALVVLGQAFLLEWDHYLLSSWFDWLTFATALVWVIGMPLMLMRGRATDSPQSLVLSLFAPVAMMSTWWVLVSLYLQRGSLYLLSLLILVWVADIAAFFVGRRLGRHKLAPNISPGKTWEGALGGLAGVLFWMVASTYWPDSFAQDIWLSWSWFGLVIWSLLLGAMSIMGDLFESLLKRRAQVKDSSRLLPGHGGVYDRIDAIVVVLPIAYVLISTVYLL